MTRSTARPGPGVAAPAPDAPDADRNTSAAPLFDSTPRAVSDVIAVVPELPASEDPRRADRPTPGWWRRPHRAGTRTDRLLPRAVLAAAVTLIGVTATGLTGLVGSTPLPAASVEGASTLPATAAPFSAPASAAFPSPGGSTVPATAPSPPPSGTDGAPRVTDARAEPATPPAGVADGALSQPGRSVATPPGAPAPAAIGGAGIASGPVHTGRGTYYGGVGVGSCMLDVVAPPMVAAIGRQYYDGGSACGAYLAVTGPTGRTVIVRVVDICHECAAGSLDLSQLAFARIAPLAAGQTTLTWRLVSPALTSPVTYLYSPGSSRYWCGIQVRNHRNPVQSLAVQVGNAWQVLQRRDYNAFESPTGAGCGNPIRIIDIYGHQLIDTGIALRPGVVQAGAAQFGPPI